MSNNLTLSGNTVTLEEQNSVILPLRSGSLGEHDPLGFDAGDDNLYRFVGNDPTDETDPSGLDAVGHHWVPQSVLTDPEIRPLLSDEAFSLGMGAYSGQTSPDHLFGTHGGVTHKEYNDTVKSGLQKFIKANGNKQLTKDQMLDFVKYTMEGKTYTGKSMNPLLKKFNDAIRAERKCFLNGGQNRGFTKPPVTADDYVKRGNSFLKAKNIFKTMAGVLMAGWAQDALANQVNALNVAADSQYFRAGIKKLSEGDLNGAENEFFGQTGYDGLYGEINAQVSFSAAASFAAAYYAAQARAMENVRQAGVQNK